MPEIDPGWSLESLLRTFRPHEDWGKSFADAYAKALESSSFEERLKGWREAAMILGDMHALALCLFVSRYGCDLLPSESKGFLGHIDLCLWDMGLATPLVPKPMPILALGKPETFRRDVEAFEAWMSDQLRPFGGDLRKAAEFSMRLTAVRLGLLIGPSKPSIEELLDASLWQRSGLQTETSVSTVLGDRKWWQIWK